MRRRLALLLGVCSSLTVVLVVSPPASAVDVAAPCAFAQRLIDDASPSSALALIETSQQTATGTVEVCPDVKQLALKAMTDSAVKTADASQALANSEWTSALNLADEALRLDADNEVAAATKSRAEARQDLTSGPQEMESDWAAYRAPYTPPSRGSCWSSLRSWSVCFSSHDGQQP